MYRMRFLVFDYTYIKLVDYKCKFVEIQVNREQNAGADRFDQ